ncbi:DUF6461 domain-containing protein [Actinoallomurus sp. NPDC052274]|uniref:DUF6461 domain-containing protein n=1 Tax=Actinoallomurus sp. NPDC052274 TaxID=3155420 RepID=UPI003426FA91
MTACADDYAWFDDYRRGWLSEMYCLTLIKDLTPVEFLSRLDAEFQGDFTGMDAFAARDMEFQDSQDLYGDYMLVGAAPLLGPDGPWTLAVEINGTVGTDDRLMATASAGTRIVSHYRNVNALTLFHWWEDGDLRTSFERPRSRSGSTPDALLSAMSRVGYGLGADGSDPGVPGKFALAEELTGVRITADLLDDATYTAGIVTMPVPEWTSITIDIPDANGERIGKKVTRQEVERAMRHP